MGLPGAVPARVPARHSRKGYYEFKPYNVGRWIVWGGFALLLAVAPMLFTSSLAHTMLSQMGIAIIVCLSYNMLLGRAACSVSGTRCTPAWAPSWRSTRSTSWPRAHGRCR